MQDKFKHSSSNSMLIKARENARIRELNLMLLEACKLEDLDRVNQLLDKGANLHLLDKNSLHSYNNNERNPIHIVTQIGNLSILKQLIEKGASCDAKDRRDETPLHLAVYNGYIEIINFLVTTCHADIESKDIDGGTPLSWAAYENKLIVAELLLNLGAKIDEPDFENRTSLHWSAYRGHVDMVKFLINAGAAISVKTKDGETPLDIAINNGRTNVVELICDITNN